MLGTARFATFELNLRTGELRNRGIRLRLRRQSAEILGMLIQRQGELVSREEIRERLWPGGTFVEFDHSVNSALNRLREVLGDSPAAPRYVETVPRQGYRFISPVEIDRPANGQPAPPSAPSDESLTLPAPKKRRSLKIPIAALVAAGILLVAATLAFHLRSGFNATNSAPLIRSVAVLPLANLSSNPDEDYFAEGVTEELLTELTHINAWRVISRTSTMRYKGTTKALPEIARELGVDAVVEGTVLRAEGRIRITAQLIQAATDSHLWAGSFERDMSQAFALQREIARSIAQAVRLKVQNPGRLDPNSRAVVPEAYEAYLRGRYFMNRSEYRKAADWLDQAVAKDAQLAPAHALLYEADAMTAFSSDLPLPLRAARALENARALDPDLADVHTDAGDLAFCWNWDWKTAEAEFRRAVELDPASVEAVAHYALYLHAMARWEPAEKWNTRLQEIDPVSPRSSLFLLRFYVNRHRYQQAENEFRKVMELDPQFFGAFAHASTLFELQGREADALQAHLNLDTRRYGSSQVQALRDAARDGGMRGYWGKQVELLLERAKQTRVPPMTFAMVYIRMGNKERAIEMLEEAYRQRAPRLVWLPADAIWDPLRSDPRFQAILRQMNLPH